MKRFSVVLSFILAVTTLFPTNLLLPSFGEDSVTVSPGNFCYTLGENFPTEDTVKLNYTRSAILTEMRGELLFEVLLTNLNQSAMYHNPGQQSYNEKSITKSVAIYVPPEFNIEGGDASIWTSFTNDYNHIQLSTTQSNDPIAPEWWKISINNLNITRQDIPARVAERSFHANLTQYIRVFNVTSPTIAGRYFFKVFITVLTPLGSETFSIGSHNFPTLVVKNGLNPAYISGVIRYGGDPLPHLYGAPLDSTTHPDGTILLPEGYGGRVYAEGLTSEDQPVWAQAYFNATAGGRYALYGLEEGTYNITVDAAGYRRTIIEAISVKRCQSLENVDIYLEEGLEVSGIVFSKHGYGEEPWGTTFNLTHPFTPRNKFIYLEVTDLDENILLESPLMLLDKLTLRMKPRDELDSTASSYVFSMRWESSWDGHIPQDYANYTAGISSGDYYVKAHVTGYAQIEFHVIHATNDTLRVNTWLDLMKTSYFEVQVYFMDGYSTSLAPTPTDVGGSLYVEVLDHKGIVAGFNVSFIPAGTRSYTIQVRGLDLWNRFVSEGSKRTAWINAHDQGLLPGTYQINMLFTNFTDALALNALLLASPEQRIVFPIQTDAVVDVFSERALESASRGTSLYLQLDELIGTIGYFCDSATSLSLPLWRAGGLDLTLYSVDWQYPPVERPWRHPEGSIRIDIYDSKGDRIGTIRTRQPSPPQTTVRVSTEEFLLGLKTDLYRLKVYTPGYLEDPCTFAYAVPVTLGMVTDSRYNLMQGSIIETTLIFKTEGIFAPIDNQLRYVRPLNNLDATPARIELFDDEGDLVAANQTYIPRGLGHFTFNLYGFDDYSGNPRILWTNFYDTTDGSQQDDGGIGEGAYLLRVTVAGYYQSNLLEVIIDSGDTPKYPMVSPIQSLERIGYLSGEVVWMEWCGGNSEALPLSWASITAYSTSSVSDDFEETYTFSLDGFYEMWLIPGEYDFGLYHPGLKTKYLRYGLSVSEGSSSSIQFFMN